MVVAAAMACCSSVSSISRSSRRRVLSHGRRTPRVGVRNGTHAGESAGVPCRRAPRDADRRTAGLGPVTTIALLLPFTFSLTPTGAIIMLAGIYYGAQYGGSIAAILVNLPGEASSTVTCLDGYAMARQGRAGLALATAALALSLAARLAHCSSRRWPPLASRRAGRSRRLHRSDGLRPRRCHRHRSGFRRQGDRHDPWVSRSAWSARTSRPARSDSRWAFPSSSTALASCPSRSACSGSRRSSASSRPERSAATNDADRPTCGRNQAKRGGRVLDVAGHGGRFGPRRASGGGPRHRFVRVVRGGKEALVRRAGARVRRHRRSRRTESANNAAAQTSFVPLLTLGFPFGPGRRTAARRVDRPRHPAGPDVIAKEPALFWGLVASMWIGNVMLLVLNLPLVGWWARLVLVPYRFLYPTTVALSCTGIYALNHSTLDLMLAAVFGVGGYLLKSADSNRRRCCWPSCSLRRSATT